MDGSLLHETRRTSGAIWTGRLVTDGPLKVDLHSFGLVIGKAYNIRR